MISSFVSYAVEKRFSKNPDKFGKGAIEGVAGPESANNSAAAGGFIPLLTRNPCQRRHGIALWGSLNSWSAAWPAAFKRTSRDFLGCGHKYVYWKCDAFGTQSPSDTSLGQGP